VDLLARGDRIHLLDYRYSREETGHGEVQRDGNDRLILTERANVDVVL
jgi:hypothetical protein